MKEVKILLAEIYKDAKKDEQIYKEMFERGWKLDAVMACDFVKFYGDQHYVRMYFSREVADTTEERFE